MRSWWRELRNDPAIPAWLRFICLVLAVLTFYSWTVQLALINVYVDPVDCREATGRLFLSLSGPFEAFGPVVSPPTILPALLLPPWAATGFVLTWLCRTGWRWRHLRLILGCVFSLVALPIAFAHREGQHLLQSSVIERHEVWSSWPCDAAGPGVFEYLAAILPGLYPVLIVFLIFWSLKFRRASMPG